MTMKNPRYWKLLAFTIAVIAISSLLFGCTKQKLEPMTNIWISEYSTLNRVYNAEGEYLHTEHGKITADSTMEILREGTWPYAVTATMAKYLIPDTEKLRFELTAENTGMRADTDEIFLWLDLKNGTDDPWLELTATGFRLRGEVTSYTTGGQFKQAVFPSTDEFYYKLTGEQEGDLQVYWQDNTLRIVSKSPGEVTLHLRDLKDTYQFPAGGCVITDFADGKIIVQ